MYNWLAKHASPDFKLNEFIKLIADEILTTVPNYTKIHGKVETLVKESSKTSMCLED